MQIDPNSHKNPRRTFYTIEKLISNHCIEFSIHLLLPKVINMKSYNYIFMLTSQIFVNEPDHSILHSVLYTIHESEHIKCCVLYNMHGPDYSLFNTVLHLTFGTHSTAILQKTQKQVVLSTFRSFLY